MLKKKYIITIVLALCITLTLFIGITTSGTNYKATNTNQYDPWVDLDGDGVVDSTDLGMLGVTWGSTGDPTRNVNVTNWEPAYNVVQVVVNCSWGPSYGGWTWVNWTFPIHVGGYSRMFAYIEPVFPNGTEGEYNITHSLKGFMWYPSVTEQGWGESAYYEPLSYSASTVTVRVHASGQWNWLYPTIEEHACVEVKAPYVALGFSSNSTISSGWMLLTISVYLRNE